MPLNVENLNKLIAHLEAQPPERINMGYGVVREHPCGSCGCIIGHADLVWPELEDFEYDEERGLAGMLGLARGQAYQLTHPMGWSDECKGVVRYPASRVIATLIRLRDVFEATGQIVVDWGPEPGEEPKPAWTPPQAIEAAVGLPVELTRFLADPAPVTAKTSASPLPCSGEV